MKKDNADFWFDAPIIKGSAINFIIGYILYFWIMTFKMPPPWLIYLIETFKPKIKALEIAPILNENPFPIQAVILYVPIGAILLFIYFSLCAIFIRKAREASYRRCCKIAEKSGNLVLFRIKIFVVSLLVIAISLFMIPIGFNTMDLQEISWQSRSFFSTNIFSVFFLMMTSSSVAICAIAGIANLIFSFSKLKNIDGTNNCQ